MKTSHSGAKLPRIDGAKIVILQSKWYREHVDNMVRHCSALLEEAGAPAPELHIVPGSLELPIAAQTIARRDGPRVDAIICFGAILKGDTFHFEMVMQGCMQGLSRIALDEGVPIIIEVLPVLKIEDLIKRSGNDEFNKGIEAAVAAAEIVSWRRSLAPQRAAPRF
jgi:6,7-dimethyl-8-ribityllumazine synthase